jgi:hypothetical protein
VKERPARAAVERPAVIERLSPKAMQAADVRSTPFYCFFSSILLHLGEK